LPLGRWPVNMANLARAQQIIDFLRFL